jgi:membrane protease YdiL (CAAX protease family)
VIAVTETNRRRAEGVIVLAVSYLLLQVFWVVSSDAEPAFASATIEATAKILLWGAGCFPIALWLSRRADTTVAEAFGLGPGVWRGVGFGFVSTLPMLAALFLTSPKAFDLDLAWGSGVVGPFAEELLFRGFLFGLLWRVAGWSVGWSILASSVLFGVAHETNVIPLAGGGAVLAWTAYRWGSLWPAIALHGCMNLWWDLANGEHARPALGPDLMSAAQLLSVTLAILISLRFGTSAASGTRRSSGERNGLSPANDLQLKIVDKLQAPRT